MPLALALLLAGCSSAPARPSLPPAAEAALTALDDHARAARPDALLVSRGGALLLERRGGAGRRPIHVRSLTKLVTASLVGQLADEGRLSLDDRVSRFLPGWEAGAKGLVTLRHLLAHSSGLDNVAGDPYVKGNRDVLKTVSEFPVLREPGATAAYDNAGYILASGAAAKAAGRPLSDYAAERLFAPLGLPEGSWGWWRDEAGTTFGHAGLSLSADGLLAFGRLWLDGGLRGDRRLLSERFVAAATSSQNRADPGFGLGWILLGRDARGRPPWDGYWMNGSDGQLLYVHPPSGVVCVQLVERVLPKEEQRPAVAGALEPCRRLAAALSTRRGG